jgi:hypothetical protein
MRSSGWRECFVETLKKLHSRSNSDESLGRLIESAVVVFLDLRGRRSRFRLGRIMKKQRQKLKCAE